MNYRTLFLCAAVAGGCGAKTIDLGGWKIARRAPAVAVALRWRRNRRQAA